MMGIDSPTGSHLPALTEAVNALPPGALVIEHGAGLYSTPLLAHLRRDIKILCLEAHPGWNEWARWIYAMTDAPVEMVDSLKRVAPRLAEASIMFIDGAALERGPLLRQSLQAFVPLIVCHDTNEGDWDAYELKENYFTWPGYTVRHVEGSHRTTVWTRVRSDLGRLDAARAHAEPMRGACDEQQAAASMADE